MTCEVSVYTKSLNLDEYRLIYSKPITLVSECL